MSLLKQVAPKETKCWQQGGDGEASGLLAGDIVALLQLRAMERPSGGGREEPRRNPGERLVFSQDVRMSVGSRGREGGTATWSYYWGTLGL